MKQDFRPMIDKQMGEGILGRTTHVAKRLGGKERRCDGFVLGGARARPDANVQRDALCMPT